MSHPFCRAPEPHRSAALQELRRELTEFAYDGLTQLRKDLVHGRVLRGTWGGCVISYRRGAPGSVGRDLQGRSRNRFTGLWDRGWLTDEEVRRVVEAELAERALDGLELPAPASA